MIPLTFFAVSRLLQCSQCLLVVSFDACLFAGLDAGGEHARPLMLSGSVNFLQSFMQAASTLVDGGEETLSLPPIPMRPIASLQPGDIRAIVTPSLKGVPTDAAIIVAIEDFADLMSRKGVAVELREEGIISDPKAVMGAHKLFFSLMGDASSSSSTSSPSPSSSAAATTQQGSGVTPAQIANADYVTCPSLPQCHATSEM